jgi:hypothetical protein
MLRDVFYYGDKPNVHPRERYAKDFDTAKQLATTEHFWIVNEFCDYKNIDWDFDFEFLPDEDVWATDHINIWPSQWQSDSGTWLCSVKADNVKIYRTDVEPVHRKNVISRHWVNTEKFDTTQFDYSWHPDPAEPPFIFQFGTQWAKTHGPQYVSDGATNIKYITEPNAKIKADMTHWENAVIKDFDYSWHPDATSPPYIYQFNTLLDLDPGPRYVVPGHNNKVVNIDRDISSLNFPVYYIQSSLDELIEQHPDEVFWALRDNIDYDKFDFTWRPTIANFKYINVFGSTESESTQSYFVNTKMIKKGYKDFNYIENKQLDDEYLARLFKPIDMFYIDRGNPQSQTQFNALKERFPNIKKTRYIGSWTDTIARCINHCSTELFWVLNSELDYSEFDFIYYPNPWQMRMIHIFGTQWTHWGNTYVINKELFLESTKYVKVIEHLNGLNFVKTKRAKASNVLYDIVYIDHGNTDMSHLVEQGKIVVKYRNSYIDTFKDLLPLLPEKKEHYVWVASSICDYSSFDFTYICDPFTREQLHVFPSDSQKFGDTFLINVNKLREVINDVELLEDTEVNYNKQQQVSRLPAPTFTNTDSHANSINVDYNFPYAVFMTADNIVEYKDTETINLWSNKDKNILITHEGGTRIIVPKEASKTVTNELYEYPYIKTISKTNTSKPLDIVFFSNGETVADQNYEHLLNVTKGMPNNVKRIDKVSGRVASQHAAANISDTNWYFLVNAKLKVSDKFDWQWQPDRLQEPKHYIFNALNPVNQLEYGHMAIVANNKKLTLNTEVNGLDFTLASKHQSLNILSGVALFNTSELETWRTAFRETLKIKDSVVKNNDTASKYRLRNWLNVAEGDYAQTCIQGANDAVKYYESVDGNMDKLMLSYDWAWLSEYYKQLYGK